MWNDHGGGGGRSVIPLSTCQPSASPGTWTARHKTARLIASRSPTVVSEWRRDEGAGRSGRYCTLLVLQSVIFFGLKVIIDEEMFLALQYCSSTPRCPVAWAIGYLEGATYCT